MSFKKAWRMMQHHKSVKKRRRRECKAKLKLHETGNFLERINDLTHAPFEKKCGMTKVRANIKRRATHVPAQVILGGQLGGISEAAAINLPALRRNIRLQRQANQQLPNPTNRQDVPELPLEYQRSDANEQFLIFDSGQGDAERSLACGFMRFLFYLVGAHSEKSFQK